MTHSVKVLEIRDLPDGIAVVSQCCDHEPAVTTIQNLHTLDEKGLRQIIAEHHKFLEQRHEGHLRAQEFKKMHQEGRL